MSAEPRPADDGRDERLEDVTDRDEAVRPLPPGAKTVEDPDPEPEVGGEEADGSGDEDDDDHDAGGVAVVDTTGVDHGEDEADGVGDEDQDEDGGVVEATVTVPRDVEATVEVSGDVEATVEIPRDGAVTTQIRAVPASDPGDAPADPDASVAPAPVPEAEPGSDRGVNWWLFLLVAIALWVVGFEAAVALQRAGVHWALSSIALVPGSYLLITRLVRRP